jgi:hypothetical protein
MGHDLVIRGGKVVDGTGMPAYSADLAVKDGRIAKIGRVDEPADRVVDADGAVVAPGFIDVHTHYDVQLDWDPLASPSCYHGVTTVLTGNCGFTLAPSKPEDVPWLAAMLSRVEGMSKEALAAGFTFAGGGFGDFWERLEGRLGVNAGGYVGHCAVRRFVMGDDASERTASPDEVAAMQVLVRQAMREGALGLSTSQLDIHVGEDGREVPSNHAAPEEILALASVLAEFDHGAIEIIPRSFAEGYDEEDRQLLLDLYRVSGKPIELNILTPTPQHPMGWQRMLDFCHEAFEQGVRLHPQFTTNRLELHLKLSDTFVQPPAGGRRMAPEAEGRVGERGRRPGGRLRRRGSGDRESRPRRERRPGRAQHRRDRRGAGRRGAGHLLRSGSLREPGDELQDAKPGDRSPVHPPHRGIRREGFHRDVGLERWGRPPRLLHRRRLHHPAAGRLGARYHLPGAGDLAAHGHARHRARSAGPGFPAPRGLGGSGGVRSPAPGGW